MVLIIVFCLFVEWTEQLNIMVLTYNNDINYYYDVDDFYYSLSWYLLLVILNKILLIKKYQRYHFDIHICNVLNCYNSRKLPKVSNVEDTQHEQKFISNKYDYNYIMITYHHMVNYSLLCQSPFI